MGETRSWTEILSRARQRLLGGEEIAEEPGPRDEILASWRRSFDEGALTSGLASPYDDNINLASRLVRAADPVIGRVHEDVLGSPITVVLADSKGKVLIRRSGEPGHDPDQWPALLQRCLLQVGGVAQGRLRRHPKPPVQQRLRGVELT